MQCWHEDDEPPRPDWADVIIVCIGAAMFSVLVAYVVTEAMR